MIIRTFHQTIMKKERCAMGQQAVTFHFTESDTSSNFPSLNMFGMDLNIGVLRFLGRQLEKKDAL